MKNRIFINMKIVISQDQLDLVKKLFFRYWKKNGPKLSDEVFSLLGDKLRTSKYFDKARGWLMEFLGGEDVAAELGDEILDTISYHVHDCGSYDFKFVIDSIESNGDFWTIYCYVDGKGTFTNLETGIEWTIKDVRNEDWAWQVVDEMAECISEQIEEKEFVNRTGIDFQVIVSGTKSDI